MALKIIKDADSWQLPSEFHLTNLDFRRRLKISPKAHADGAADISDQKIEPRYLSLEGLLSAENDSEYDNKWNELILKISQKDFYLRDGDWQILIHRTRDVKQSFDPGLRKRLSEIEIEFVALDPFWYHKDLSYEEQSCSSPPTEFTVTNDGNYMVYPVIKITANANNPSMSVKNKSDNNILFSYSDGGFTTGKQLIVNCKEGIVQLDEVDTIRYFDGQFLKLLAGNNTIEYDGAAATIRFEWHKRCL